MWCAMLTTVALGAYVLILLAAARASLRWPVLFPFTVARLFFSVDTVLLYLLYVANNVCYCFPF